MQFPDKRERAPQIAGTGCRFPGPRYAQKDLFPALREAWTNFEYDEQLARHFFESVGVGGRHLALNPERYAGIDDFGEANDHYIRRGTELGAEAVEAACRAAGVDLRELDALFFTTVTGVASPSLDAKIINALELDRGVDRVPMFGLGCVGGAAGLARAASYLRGHPDRTAALLAVELCSLTVERNDPDIADLIAAALFADGAVSVVCDGAAVERECSRSAPRIVSSDGVLYRDSEWVMGWEIGEHGFELVLSGDLPRVISSQVGDDVAGFLDAEGLGLDEIDRWICHPGGPKVLEATASALELGADRLASARESLRSVGNLSSASVLHVLDNQLEAGEWDGPAVLMAMGPGFSAEFLLLEP